MGCDIHGYIEVRPHWSKDWSSMTDLGVLLGRNYDMFSKFFGVRQMTEFTPLFANRGVPEYSDRQKKHDDWDSRCETQKEYERWDGDAHSASYFYANELDKIDLDESKRSGYISEYEPDGKGGWKDTGMGFGWSSVLEDYDTSTLETTGVISKDKKTMWKRDMVTPKVLSYNEYVSRNLHMEQNRYIS
jgi:hypothetical protein